MNKAEKRHHNVIGRHLLRQSLLLAFVLTILFTAFQVWLNYRDVFNSIQSTMQNIEAVQAKGISTALWNVSTAEIDAQNSGIIHFPFVNYAAVYENEQLVTEAGIRKDEGYQEKNIPLTHQNIDGQEITIGRLYIQADTSAIAEVVISQVWRLFIFQALNVILVIFIILLLIDKRVTRYLVAAAHFFNNASQHDLAFPLNLNKKPASDEIDTLVDSFNHMRVNLAEAVRLQFESERKLATLLSNLPGMAFRCQNNTQWTLELVSAGCLSLTGYKEEELAGDHAMSFIQIIHPADYQRIWQDVQSSLSNKQPFELTFRILTKKQKERWVWERGTGVYSEGGELQYIEGFITDITEKKQHEREIEAIAATSYALRTAIDREEMLSITLKETVNLLNADGASIELIDTANDEVNVTIAQGVFQQFSGVHFPGSQGERKTLSSTGEFCVNIRELPQKDKIFPYHEAHCSAICGVPMIAHEKRIGYLWIGWMNEISENVVRSLAAIADIAANAIFRADLFSKTEQQLMKLIGLRKIDEAINNNQELPSILRILLEQAIELLNVDAANILLLDENSRIFTSEISMGFQGKEAIQRKLSPMEQYIGSAILTRSLIKINDITKTRPEPSCEEVMLKEGFASYFAAPLVTQNEVKGVLQVFHKSRRYPDQDWYDFLQALAGQAAIAVSQAHLIGDLQHSNLELQLAYDDTIAGWSNALDLRDKETEGHSQRVTDLTLVLALMMGIKGEELVHIRRGSLLHDIGKMGVPDQILLKPGPLNEEEWEIMRQHPTNAYKLLSPIEYLHPALDIPYSHHEKYDGSGYPQGLKGEEIPLSARIFAVVDVWDALTSDRPYRPAVSTEESLQYIRQQSGRHFDPDVVEIFLKLRKERSITDWEQ